MHGNALPFCSSNWNFLKTKKFPYFFQIAPNSWNVVLGGVLFLATVPISHVRRQEATPQVSRWLYHQPPWHLPRKPPPSPGKPWEGAPWPVTRKSGPIGGGGRQCWANQKHIDICLCSNIFTFVDVFINSPYPSTKWYSKSSTKWRCLTLAYDLVLI